MRWEMNSPPEDLRPPVFIILGPTAVGKTEVSLQLAERLEGEIVSADSRLLYRGMDIGTAKPSQEERARVPHHLIDVAEPDEIWSLAVFQREARRAVHEIHDRGRLPFLVGGTGQYLRAVTEGWQPPTISPNETLRAALENWAEEIGTEAFHHRLSILDLEAASAIDHRNLRRTIRALEVIFLSGKRFSEQRMRGVSPYRTLQIGLNRPRPELYARVDERVDAMLAAGLVDEVRGLLERGFSPDLPTLSAIGYKEILAHLQEEISLEEAVRLIKRNTRIYVRRQANWFKENDPDIHWFEAGPGTVDVIEKVIRDWLG
jgi:tRNA dimethylallyltransferase